MAATRLPDGSVVMQPSGQRAYPTGGGTGVTRPSQAKGSSGGKGAAVPSKQAGRVATGKNAYR